MTESTGTTTAYPDFAYQEFDVAVDYINSGRARGLGAVSRTDLC